MNILLWILQIALALHTAIGAFWKFSNSEQSLPSLKALPHGVWVSMGGLELILAVCLVLPLFSASMVKWAPIAAIVVAVEMLLYCGLHLASDSTEHGQLVYWLVVAAVCAFIAWGRLS